MFLLNVWWTGIAAPSHHPYIIHNLKQQEGECGAGLGGGGQLINVFHYSHSRLAPTTTTNITSDT